MTQPYTGQYLRIELTGEASVAILSRRPTCIKWLLARLTWLLARRWTPHRPL